MPEEGAQAAANAAAAAAAAAAAIAAEATAHIAADQIKVASEKQIEADLSREVRQALIAQTTLCDGSNREKLRMWVKEVGLAHKTAPAHAAWVAVRTATGALRVEVERACDAWKIQYPAPHVSRHDMPWLDMEHHVVNTFLGAEEGARRRGELQKLKQKSYETISTFAIRFQDEASQAYPDRNAVYEQILRDQFLKGLRDDRVARKVSAKTEVNTLRGACDAACAAADADDRYSRLQRGQSSRDDVISSGNGETPMEIDALRGKNAAKAKKVDKSAKDNNLDAIGRLAQEVHIMRQENAAVEQLREELAAAVGPRVSQTPVSSCRSSGVGDSKKIVVGRQEIKCFNCGKFGHIQRECRARPQFAPNSSSNRFKPRFEGPRQSGYSNQRAGPGQSTSRPQGQSFPNNKPRFSKN